MCLLMDFNGLIVEATLLGPRVPGLVIFLPILRLHPLLLKPAIPLLRPPPACATNEQLLYLSILDYRARRVAAD